MVIILRYIKNYYENTIIINKSKFIGQIYNVSTIDEIQEILKNTRKKYYDATHNCYAYILGDNQEIQKCSDDGEPQKTAGAPMLDVLKKQQMTNILVIVTRYFGGILLGAGGLVRAYSEATSKTLDIATKYIKKDVLEIVLPLSYKAYNQVVNLDYINIVDINYTMDVICTIRIDKEYESKFTADINNILQEYDNTYEFELKNELIQ